MKKNKSGSMEFALIGNPNSGKTTLFNALTGASAEVGNWPGVTVDKKVGVCKKIPGKPRIIDLPGIYSLSPYTSEESVSRRYLLEENPGLIINIVDATNLERNLYLTLQLLETDIPVVVALNMMDEAGKYGVTVDAERLAQKLNVPVIKVSALKKKGLAELMRTALAACSGKRRGAVNYSDNLIKEQIALISDKLGGVKHSVFHAVKVLEGDNLEKNTVETEFLQKVKSKRPDDVFKGDYEGIIAAARYDYIAENIVGSIYLKNKSSAPSKSQKIDKFMTHKYFGIPIFLGIMLLAFHLTFSENLFLIGAFIKEGTFDIPIIGTDAINSPGAMLSSAMGMFTDWLTTLASAGLQSAPLWVHGLIVDGILSGVFAIFSFVPQIVLLFFFLTLLQSTGYMARVVYIMDKLLRKFGLSGKAFMPLLTCFGCAVPGIMAARTLGNDTERRLTIMLAPFFSCGAKLPIWTTFASVLYGGAHSDLVVFGIYILGIVVAVIAAVILKLTVVKGEIPPFIMELPEYRVPQFKSTMLQLWDKLKHYIVKAGTVIAGSIVVIWTLTSFDFTFHMVEDMGESILGTVSKGLRYLFVPLGFGMGDEGWKFVLAAFSGLVAKEMVVGTMGTLSGMSGAEAEELSGVAGGGIALLIGSISVPASLAFMAFNLLTVPCMAAVSAARSEIRSRKFFWMTIAFWLATSYVTALAVYWVGMYLWLGAVLAGATAVLITVLVLVKRAKARRR